jgi:hypothetical protein
MDNITIPPEAFEAAAIEMAPAPWSMYTEDAQEHFRRKARAACLAMLSAWPGMSTRTGIYTDIILPLPREPSNDK